MSEAFLRATPAVFLIVASLGAQRALHVEDPAAPAALAASDARLLEVREEHGELRFAVTMAAPLQSGMFTCVHVFVDCDGHPESGLQGAELWIRAAVGSRFWPNATKPAEGEPAPLDLRRTTGSEIAVGGKADAKSWMHTIVDLPPPEVDGSTLRFSFPVALITKQNRYEGDYRFRVDVETSSSEQPLVIDHRILDEGLPIRLDGALDDFRGGDRLDDPGGELHPSARSLDIRSLRVEHGSKALFLGIEFDAPGFGEAVEAGDVTVLDAVHAFIDTPFPRYQEPWSVRIPRGHAEQDGAGFHAVAKKQYLEVRLDRVEEQRRVLVHLWTDAERRDSIADGQWLSLQGGSK